LYNENGIVQKMILCCVQLLYTELIYIFAIAAEIIFAIRIIVEIGIRTVITIDIYGVLIWKGLIKCFHILDVSFCPRPEATKIVFHIFISNC